MSKLLVLPMLAGALLLVGPSAAAAEPVPDVTCPGPGEESMPSGDGDYRFAQTFTAQTTGNLTDVQTEVDKGGTVAGDWILSINTVHVSGTPTNAVLATTTLPDATVPFGPATVVGTFASPAPVTAGEQYALVITRPGADHFTVRVRTKDACAGESFVSISEEAQFQTLASICCTGADIVFTVWVEPAPVDTEPPPVDTDPPETTITKDAPKTTEKHKFKFKFVSDEPGSTFECKLDKNPYKPCTSPKKAKVDEGKHKFAVKATDAAGNVDPTPDKDKFKVVG